MILEELTGREHDPNCLHCVLAQRIGEFILTHGGYADGKIVGDLLQVTAEYIASTAPCPDRVASGAARRLEAEVAECFRTLRLAGKR